MSARAAILVTGTEVLSGRVADRNGPWLSERLLELGVEVAYITVVGDRPADIEMGLAFAAQSGVDVAITSGGLGPTADDLTAEVVGRFQGREMVVDEALEGRIAQILARVTKRWPGIDLEAVRHGNRKQATIPQGAAVLEPVGTAPGLVVPPAEGREGPTVVVLPGPPRELQPMWPAALETAELRAALAGAREHRLGVLRLFGIPESEIAETLREAQRQAIPLDELEVTTCLRRGEIEIVTRYEPPAEGAYRKLEKLIAERHADTLFSTDGSTVDEQVAALLAGDEGTATLSIATAESCTGGLLAARLTERPGASAYVRGAIVAYENEVKVSLAGVERELIERHGAVSREVAVALARGARERLGAAVGVGITGVAGPGGGSEEKPVGLVWLSVAVGEEEPLTRSLNLPGGRSDVRDRATTVALHMIRRAVRERAVRERAVLER